MKKIARITELSVGLDVIMGDTYGEAAAKNGVAKSSVSRIVQDFRRIMPEFDEIRNVIIHFRKSGLSTSRAKEALDIKERLERLGLSLDSLEKEVDAMEKLGKTRFFTQMALGALKNQKEILSINNQELRKRNFALQFLDESLTTGSFQMPCKTCNAYFPVPLWKSEYYTKIIQRRQVFWLSCKNCGYRNQYSPHELLTYFALCLLPREEDTIIRFDLKLNLT